MTDVDLYKLPNELLLHLFVPLPTPELLPLTLISRRLSSIVLRILHNRLVAAAELESHSLLLECYHPSAKLSQPPYFCAYQGTDGLSLYDESTNDNPNIAARLKDMRCMYSRFRPFQRELAEGGRRVLPRPGDVPGSRTFPGTVQDKYQGDAVKQTLSLESHELFTQLVAQANLVKIGPRHGFLTCCVEVEEGVLRVWRQWLKDVSARGLQVDNPQHGVVEDGAMMESPKEKANVDDARILWVSPSKNVGIRFNVSERRFRRDTPVLLAVDEDMPVSYNMEYDELFIRTSHLLLKLEKSFMQEDNSSGKAVVFGTFG